MNSKAFVTGSLALLLLGGIAFEYAPGVVSPAASPPAKTTVIAFQPPLRAGPAPGPMSRSSAENPPDLREEGYRRIVAFQSAGEFERAAEMATDGPERLRRDWIIAAYHEWGRRQPELAFASATQIQDAIVRETALQSVFSGWARTDPEGLAELAFNRPEGPEKTAALTKAIRAWINKDPWTAGDWIATHESSIPIAEKMFRDDRR